MYGVRHVMSDSQLAYAMTFVVAKHFALVRRTSAQEHFALTAFAHCDSAMLQEIMSHERKGPS